MKNPATFFTHDDFNDFTIYLLYLIEHGHTPLVLLRDGRHILIDYQIGTGADEGYDYFCYKSGDTFLIWNNDGTSITSRDFDIMELV